MRRRAALASAFEAAAGPPVELCSSCVGAPCPPAILLSIWQHCDECLGLLDEDGRPTESVSPDPLGGWKPERSSSMLDRLV